MKNVKRAFTLAEVLITLTIVGVIAALTIPTLMQKYEKQQTITGLKRMYSILNDATKRSIIDNGEISTWDFSLGMEDFFDKYLKNYLKITKNCGVSSNAKCTKVKRFDLNGDDASLYYFNNSFKATYSAILSDGTPIWLFPVAVGGGYLIGFDINGDKGPNRNGRDVFAFSLTVDGLWGYSHYNRKPGGRYDWVANDGACNRDAKYSAMGAGGGCSTMIMYDNWQIKDDYPW